MEVTQQEAYAEACLALGETLVAQRLMAKELGKLQAQNAALIKGGAAGDGAD